ncbi:MAG: prepilin-type N-terminal cleavage/methylation domain-containing protein [Thermoguttaceae bacterium]|nr:prepilin-type N-terminal cleavage/methylation domain-containing protein [Thermoguttaceae bacterium]
MTRVAKRAAGRRAPQGFTLIEILVVIVIIGLLASIAFVAFGGARGFFAGATAKARLTDLETALEIYKQKYGEYPPDSCACRCCANPASPNYDKARNIVRRHILKRWPKVLKTGEIDNMIAEVGSRCDDHPGKALLFWIAFDGDGFCADEENPFGLGLSDAELSDEPRETPIMELAFDSDGTNGGNYNDRLGLMFQNKSIAYFRAEKGAYDGKRFDVGDEGLAQPYMKNGSWYNADSFQLIFPGEDGLFGEADEHEDEHGHQHERDLVGGEHSSFSAADADNVTNFAESGTLEGELE